MRGIAILLILYHHYINDNLVPTPGRACRILPAYLALVVVSYIRHPAAFVRPAGAPLWQFLTFTQIFWLAAMGTFGTLAITRSLAIEEQFYLTAPALIRWITPQRLGRALAACLVLAPLLRIALFFFLPPHQAHFTGYVMTHAHGHARDGDARRLAAPSRRDVPMRRLYAAFFALGAVVLLLAWVPLLGYLPISYGVYALFYACVLLIAIQRGFRLLR